VRAFPHPRGAAALSVDYVERSVSAVRLPAAELQVSE
jgi:hypothetical protein